VVANITSKEKADPLCYPFLVLFFFFCKTDVISNSTDRSLINTALTLQTHSFAPEESAHHYDTVQLAVKEKSVALVRKRTIPTERPSLVDEVSANILWIEGVTWSAQRIPTAVNLGFLDRSRYFLEIVP
jgi:hypothetical protein